LNKTGSILLNAFYLLALVFLTACTANTASPTPTQTPTTVTITVAELQENYSSYEGQLVRVRGYGVIMMSAPLCPGYVGMDTRLSFLGEGDNSIHAIVTASALGAERSENLREFQAYVRTFNGEIGCPGSLQTVTFPFLEIVGVEE
jgi:hypothetical protein